MNVIQDDELRLLTTVVAEAGLTYRQADHWLRCGYLTAHAATRVADVEHGERLQIIDASGSGYVRVLKADGAQTLLLMARLTRAGFAPVVAAEIARKMLDHPGEPIELDGQLAIADLQGG